MEGPHGRRAVLGAGARRVGHPPPRRVPRRRRRSATASGSSTSTPTSTQAADDGDGDRADDDDRVAHVAHRFHAGTRSRSSTSSTASVDYESGWTSPYRSAHPVFTSARRRRRARCARDGARSTARFRRSTDERLEQVYTSAFGPTSGALLVAAQLNEISHHGAQICQLRDLYRATRRRNTAPADACAFSRAW